MVSRSRRLITLIILFACGQTTAMGDRAMRPEQARVPVIARPKVANVNADTKTAPLAHGPLDNTAALKHFFTALGRLDDGTAIADVRIVQFGDSHTAADLETGVIRRALQGRFGDGGRGFVAIGKPWRSYWQDGIHAPGMSREWSPEHVRVDHGHYVGDGCYGLSGVCLVTNRPGARAWSEISSPFSHVEVAYFEQPSGGSFDLLVDEKVVGTVRTHGAQPTSAYKTFDVADAPHKLEIRARGDGDVRVFGASLDRTDLGVMYDALGINGARASTALHWNEAHMAEQLRHRAPDLVVLAYGTNEAADSGSVEEVEHQLVDVLGRIARAVPTASCLLLGPPDRAIATPSDNPYADVDAGSVWVAQQKLSQVVAAERRVAGAAGCAFYDQQAAMGGPGSMVAWADLDPPRAQRDRTHLTREGYALLGNAFASDVMAAYGAWRLETGLTPAKPIQPSPLPTLTPPEELVPPSSSGSQSPFVAIPL